MMTQCRNVVVTGKLHLDCQRRGKIVRMLPKRTGFKTKPENCFDGYSFALYGSVTEI